MFRFSVLCVVALGFVLSLCGCLSVVAVGCSFSLFVVSALLSACVAVFLLFVGFFGVVCLLVRFLCYSLSVCCCVFLL